MTRICGLLLILIILSACGRKGPLVRPEALVPEKVSDFKVKQQGDHLQLSWSIPGKLVSGSKLTDLAGFTLFVRTGLTKGGGCSDCWDDWKADSRFDLEYLQGAARIGNTLYSSYPNPGLGVTRGFRIIPYTKSSVEGPPVDLQFTGKTILPAPDVAISSTYVKTTMKFTPHTLPEGYTLTGYSVYRFKPGEPVPTIPYAIVKEGNTFEDSQLEMGVIYSWLVTVNAVAGSESVEGLPAVLSAGLAEPD